MLWDLIRDFFVQHVFGGYDSNADFYSTIIGYDGGTGDFVVNDMPTFNIGNNNYIGIGDWLSTTATMISIIIIVVLCCLFVYKIIKLIGGLIR